LSCKSSAKTPLKRPRTAASGSETPVALWVPAFKADINGNIDPDDLLEPVGWSTHNLHVLVVPFREAGFIIVDDEFGGTVLRVLLGP
jgi:hypothetical protein